MQQGHAKRNINIEAGEEIRLTWGRTVMTMTADGPIRMNGIKICVIGDRLIELLADKVKIN